MRLRFLSLFAALPVVVAAFAGCGSSASFSSSGAGGFGTTSGGAGGGLTATGTSASTATSTSTGTGGSVSGPPPDPACVVPDVDTPTTSIELVPDAPTSADPLTIAVSDTMTGYTNVVATVCSPDGQVLASFGGLDSPKSPYKWHWTSEPLAYGTSQIIFRADPNSTVYETAHIYVASAPTDGGDGGTQDVCKSPGNNLLQHGTFEEGLAGEAPLGWHVRDPNAPTACQPSGTPDQHLFLSSAGMCGGNALTIDARGQWDCYAVEIKSDPNTIVGGQTYRISASVRSSGNATNDMAWFVLGAQWLDAQDVVFGDEKNPQPMNAADNDYGWKVMSWEVVAPANATRILVWATGHYPGRVDFDNVSVVKL
jgi:hypothetical protein